MSRLPAAILRKHHFITRSVAEYDKALAQAARTIERRLIAVALSMETKDGKFVANAVNRKRLIIARGELQDAFGAEAYKDATRGLLERADELLEYHKDVADAYGPKVQFAGTDIKSIRILKDGMTRRFAGIGEEQARIIGEQLDMMVLTGQPVSKATKAIATHLDEKFAPYAKTYAQTSLAIYDRLVAAATYPTEDDEEYLYAGPIDDLCRPFCAERVGNTYTYAEIQGMDNGQLPDVFTTCGGYNCRHQWLHQPKWGEPDAVEQAMTDLKEAA